VKKRVAHNTAFDRVKCPRIVPTQIMMRSVKDALLVSCSMSDCVIRDFLVGSRNLYRDVAFRH